MTIRRTSVLNLLKKKLKIVY